MINRQIKVIVNGNVYEVEVGDLGSFPTTVVVNGRPYEVEIQPGTAPVKSQASRPAQPVVRILPAEAPAQKPVVRAETQAASGDGNVVAAPMPGTILDIAVKPGASVCRGDPLCALEAMKMKSAIRAPKAGVIASVEVSEGQKVAFGDVLIRYA
jgi:glutaconyl-CoA/methylmalonyl-CoA decarboxylase subunit gamma